MSAVLADVTATGASTWELKPLAEVADILDGKRIPVNAKERENRHGQVPYYGATGQVGWIDDFLFDEELVLLGEDGAPFLEPSKPKAYVIRGKSWVNNHAHVLRARAVPTGWLAHFLNVVRYDGLVTGTTRLKLTQAAMRQIRVPVAPWHLMEKCVAEIEKQFSRLDEAVAHLKRVRANLKRYKASVLADAIRGKLSRSGDTWTQASLGEIASSVRNGISKKPDADSGTRILRISAVRPLMLDTGDVRYLPGPLNEYESFRIDPGDVLFTRYNGSVDLVGVCALVPQLIQPTVYPDKLIRVRLPRDVLMPEFLVIAASTGDARAFIQSRIRTTAGQAGVSGADIKALPLRIPPLLEQRHIVAEVDRRLSILREVELEVEQSMLRGSVLRQSALHSAFTRGPRPH